MYPGMHNLYSRDWTSDDQPAEPPLGEWSGERERYSGKPPLRVPLPIRIGSADCIANGEKPGLAIVERSALCARVSPDACYAAAQLFLDKTDVLSCVFAKISVDIINTAYASVMDAADEVQAFLGPDAVVTPFEQANDLTPAGVVAIINDTALMWITGTTNFNQLAVQAFYFGFGPINQGFYSASGIYESAALSIGGQLGAVGGGVVSRVVLMGHSFGGAVAMVLATKMKLAGPSTRQVEVLTFGAPKPGDRRLHDIIANVRQNHYVNQEDPIPLMPPEGLTLAALWNLVPDFLVGTWGTFVRPPNLQMIFPDGRITDVAAEDLPDGTIYALGLLISQGLDAPAFKDHATDWYSYYLCNACKCVPRPCVPPPDVVATQYRMIINFTWVPFLLPMVSRTIDGIVTQIDIDHWDWIGGGDGVPFEVVSFAVPPFKPTDAIIHMVELGVPGMPFGIYDFALPDLWWRGGTFGPLEKVFDSSTNDPQIVSVIIEKLDP